MIMSIHPTTDLDFAEQTERHRHELQVHCYRMLSSFIDAQDLVQETLLRAWRRRDPLQDGDNLRARLCKIATNACLGHIKAKRRRLPSLASFRDVAWLEPSSDRLLTRPTPYAEEPDSQAVEREMTETPHPGSLTCRGAGWRNVLAVVERGGIEIRSASAAAQGSRRAPRSGFPAGPLRSRTPESTTQPSPPSAAHHHLRSSHGHEARARPDAGRRC